LLHLKYWGSFNSGMMAKREGTARE
jgi:hypothetical protein